MLGMKRKKEWKREEKRKKEEEDDEGLEIGKGEAVLHYYLTATVYLIITNTLLSTEYTQKTSSIQQQNHNIQSIHQSVNHHINSSIQCCCVLFPRVCLLRFARLGLSQPPDQKQPLGFHPSEVAGDNRFLQTVRKKIIIIIPVGSCLVGINLCSRRSMC